MSTGFEGLDLSKLVTIDTADVDACGVDGCGPVGEDSENQTDENPGGAESSDSRERR